MDGFKNINVDGGGPHVNSHKEAEQLFQQFDNKLHKVKEGRNVHNTASVGTDHGTYPKE